MTRILEKESKFDPSKGDFETWAYYQCYNYFRSYFRDRARQARLRSELASDRPGRKGLRRHDRLWDNKPSVSEVQAAVDGNPVIDNFTYDIDHKQADTLPALQDHIDLHNSIDKLPARQADVMRLVAAGVNDDNIAWRLKVHPGTVSLIKQEAIARLREIMTDG